MSTILLDPAMTGEAPVPKEVPAFGAGTWPRMLKLDTETENRLLQFLDDEIESCYTERQDIVADWVQWQTDYWAKPDSPEKNFPFRRAANVVVPLTAIAVEAIYARIINTLFSVEPFWSIRPRTKEWIEAAPFFQEWLQIEVEGPLNVFGFCRNSILELIKLGTAVGKSGYEREVRKSFTQMGEEEVERWVEIRNSATLDHVPLANFLIRLHEVDPQQAVWVGEEHTFNWAQVKRFAMSGRYKSEAIEKIKTYWTTRDGEPSADGEYNRTIDAAAHTEPTWNEVFRIQEIWLSFDVDKDGIDEEIVLDYHKDSRTILSMRYNWYDDLHRPYRINQYIPVENRAYGIGVGKQNEQFQQIITTIHRQRLDNSTLNNMMQLALKKSSGYGPGEPLFPGKLWFFDDPSNDVRELKLHDTPQAQINNEEYARTYADRRTGANDDVLGMPQSGTPGTATSDLSRLAEGNKRFDLVLKGVRRWLSALGADVVANYQQFGDLERHWVIMGENGEYVDRILKMPAQLVRDGALIEVTVTDSITNNEVQRQQWMGLFAVLSQHYDRILSQAATLGSPEIFMIVGQAALAAGDYAIRRLVATYKEANLDVNALLMYPKIEELFNAAQNGQSPIGAIGAAARLGGAPGMGGLLAPPRNGGGSTQSGTSQQSR